MTEAASVSARQRECLARIAARQTSADIAAAVGLSVLTVDHYRGDACAKLGARSRAQAVATAIGSQFICGRPIG
jgi:DNA-binding CsgD family transcriptional regulator